jgi:hypothetical protein
LHKASVAAVCHLKLQPKIPQQLLASGRATSKHNALGVKASDVLQDHDALLWLIKPGVTEAVLLLLHTDAFKM